MGTFWVVEDQAKSTQKWYFLVSKSILKKFFQCQLQRPQLVGLKVFMMKLILADLEGTGGKHPAKERTCSNIHQTQSNLSSITEQSKSTNDG